jgi:hypothetical protein
MKIKAKNWMIPWLVASLFGTQAQGVLAGERESLEEVRATTMNLIELLVQEGVLSKDKADALLKQAQAAKQKAQEEAASVAETAAPEAPPVNAQSKAIRVQYVPEHVKNEMRAEIEQEVMKKLNYKAGERLGIPEWIDRIELTGDLRLRYQLDQFPPGNTLPATLNSSQVRNVGMTNTTEDRERQRVRARFGANLHVNDWLSGGIRFTTGQLNTPVTPNQTEGFSQGKYIFGLDRAFLAAKPLDWLTLTGGRFANPFYSTDLIWDPDLAFDGLVANANPKLNDRWQMFSTLGAFPLQEVESSDTNRAGDKWMYAAQAGIEWTANNKSKVKLGFAFYDFKNVEGRLNPVTSPDIYDGTIMPWRQKGNNTFSIDANVPGGVPCGATVSGVAGLCGLASKFQLINLTGQVDLLTFDPIHVILQGDYVKNVGFDQKEILRRTNNTYKEENEGYQVSLMVGKPLIKKRADWQVFGGYKYLEADAVLDGFTDSNFHLGGTDAKGYYLGGHYGIGDNAWLTALKCKILERAHEIFS